MSQSCNPDEGKQLYYPNKFARIMLDSLEEVMGRNGINALLHLAELPKYIVDRPPDNLKKEFPFSDFTALQIALEEMYGPRGGRGLAVRAGRVTFKQGLEGFGALSGVGDLAFRMLPLSIKMKLGLPALANFFSQFSDQISNVHDEKENFVYTLEQCPMCCNRQATEPVCHFGLGHLQEALTWVSGGHTFHVKIAACMAQGDEMGRYEIIKRPVS